MTAQQYKDEHKKLMDRWESECRKWFAEEIENNSQPLNINANFFEDGIFDPSIWFSNKSFRPLFILKEVHDNGTQESKRINHVAMCEDKTYDIWNRQGRGMWRSLGALAKGMFKYLEEDKLPAYEELYAEDIEEYRTILRKIAIINIKKVPGGGNVNAKESIQTKCFTCHANKFKANLKEQISLINPTVIIFCGTDVPGCFDIIDGKLYGIPVVAGLHPAISANRHRENFYNRTIKQVKEIVSR